MKPLAPALHLALLAGLAAVIACGSSSSALPAPTATPLPDVKGWPRSETLVLLGYEPTRREDIDPATNGGSADGYKGLLFSGLVRFTPDLKLAPDLARDWSVSDDGLTYTFDLEPEARFSDGTPVTAEDVVYSWTRALDPERGVGNNAYLDDIDGATALADGNTDTLSGVTALDDHTLQVRLRAPNVFFLGKLTYPVAFVVQRANVESGGEWYLNPVSSGPYALDVIKPYESVTLMRQDGYAHPPAIHYVLFLTNEGGNPLSLFEGGEIDWLDVWNDDARLIRNPAHRLHDRLRSVTSLCTSYLVFNTNRPGLDNPDVREALALAINRDQLFATLIDGDDRRATTLLPPAMPGFEPRPEPAFDPEAARAALARSGYQPGDLDVRFSVSGSSNQVGNIVATITQGWRDTLGISVTVQVLDWYTFGASVDRYPTDVIDTGWCADYPDAQNFFDPIAYSTGSYNDLHYANRSVDDWLDSARAETDPIARQALYHKVETRLLDDHVILPISHSAYAAVVNPRVEGYVLTPFSTALIPWLSLKP